jgi:hypothetical protein
MAEAYSNPGAQGRFPEDHFYAPPPQPVRPLSATNSLPNPASQQQIPASQPLQPTLELEAGAVLADPHLYPPPPLPQSQIDLYSAAHEKPPSKPPRPDQSAGLLGATSQYGQVAYAPQSQQSASAPALPPRRRSQNFGADDPSDPTYYTRDPPRLIAYLVPFPKPRISGIDPTTILARFFIYTPPPPPLVKPAEGEKEATLHKVQRK